MELEGGTVDMEQTITHNNNTEDTINDEMRSDIFKKMDAKIHMEGGGNTSVNDVNANAKASLDIGTEKTTSAINEIKNRFHTTTNQRVEVKFHQKLPFNKKWYFYKLVVKTTLTNGVD